MTPERIPNHLRRFVGIWLILTAISVPLIVLVLGPHLPPGRMSAEAGSQRDANVFMTALLFPIALLVVASACGQCSASRPSLFATPQFVPRPFYSLGLHAHPDV